MTDGSKTSTFVAELKRRKVVRVAIAYVGVAIAVLEAAERIFLVFVLPESLQRALVIALAAGLPMVLVLSWIFDLTSKGIELTPDAASESVPSASREGLGPRFSRQLVVSGAIVVLAMTAVGWRYMPNDRAEFADDRVAVLPFENRTGDAELDHLGVLVADHIVNGLSSVETVTPVPMGQTMLTLQGPPSAPGESPLPPERAVAEATGSALVIAGSYAPAGDEIAFQATVYEGKSGDVVFAAEPVRADPTDPMADLERVRDGLFGFFGMFGNRSVELSDSAALRLARAPSYAAYREFAVGLEMQWRGDWRGAAEQYERAYGLDSTFYMALFRQTGARMNIGDWEGLERVVGQMEEMRAELRPLERAGIDWAKGILEGDLRATHDAAVRQAEEVPVSQLTYLAGLAAMGVNRPQEAIEYFRMFDLERSGPRWPAIWTVTARAYHQLDQHRRELRWIRRGRDQHPGNGQVLAAELEALAARGRGDEVEARIGELGFPGGPAVAPGRPFVSVVRELEAHGDPETSRRLSEHFLTRLDGLSSAEKDRPPLQLMHARVLAGLGRYDESAAILTPLLEAQPDRVDLRGWSGLVAAGSGDREAAETAIEWLGARDIPYQGGRPVLWQARIAAALGEAERTVRFLEAAFELGAQDFGSLHSHQAYRPVREHPTFVAYMEPAG